MRRARRRTMVKRLTVLAVSLGSMALAGPAAVDGAQSDAAFAGRWVLVAAKPTRPGYDQFWLGTEAVVAQTATTVEITRAAPAPERHATFALGKETQNVYTLAGQKVVRDSRATLRDGLLLISTETTTNTAPRRLSNLRRWSRDSDGMLTVTDTEICGNGECPSIITTLRFRR